MREEATALTQASSPALWMASIISLSICLCTGVVSAQYLKTARKWSLCITLACLINIAKWPVSAVWSNWLKKMRSGLISQGWAKMISLHLKIMILSSLGCVWANGVSVKIVNKGFDGHYANQQHGQWDVE